MHVRGGKAWVGLAVLAGCAGTDGENADSVSAATLAVTTATATPRASGTDTIPTDVAAPPSLVHCADDTCPEIVIDGDPYGTLPDGAPSPFRGYGDPSLETARDGTLWLAYSWLEVWVHQPGVVDFGVETHVASSADGGASFQFVRDVNHVEEATHPDTGALGLTMHEISTLVLQPDGRWQLLWLDYFDLRGDGPENRSDVRFVRSIAAGPEALGDMTDAVMRNAVTSASFGSRLSSSDLAELSDCSAVTEPALFATPADVFLAVECIVLEDGVRRPDRERVALLREEADTYTFVGDLLTGADAARSGVDLHTQADLSVGRDGSVLLTVTPTVLGGDPQHRGCVVYEVEDITRAQIARHDDGSPVLRAEITADAPGFGAGLCAYDAAATTGVLMVTVTFQPEGMPANFVFTLRETGVHP